MLPKSPGLNISISMSQYFIDTVSTVSMTHHPVCICMAIGIKVTKVSLYQIKSYILCNKINELIYLQ